MRYIPIQKGEQDNVHDSQVKRKGHDDWLRAKQKWSQEAFGHEVSQRAMRCFCCSLEVLVPRKSPEAVCFVRENARRKRLSLEKQYKQEDHTDKDQCYPLGPSPVDVWRVADISAYDRS